MGERTVGNWMGGVPFDDEVSHGMELTGREKETIADVFAKPTIYQTATYGRRKIPSFALGSGYSIYLRVILLNHLAMDKNLKVIAIVYDLTRG
jgi:hypothetical protein